MATFHSWPEALIPDPFDHPHKLSVKVKEIGGVVWRIWRGHRPPNEPKPTGQIVGTGSIWVQKGDAAWAHATTRSMMETMLTIEAGEDPREEKTP